MPTNIIDSLLNSAQQLVAPLATYLGASPIAVKSALSAAFPTLLSGLMQQAATPRGARDVFDWITHANVDTGALSDASALIDPNRASSLTSQGSALLSKLLGDRTGQVNDAIGAATGLKSSSAGSVLAFAAPMLLASIKKQVTAGNLNPSGLRDLLVSQKGFVEKLGLDSRIARALGFSTLSSLLDAVPSTSAAAMQGAKALAAGTAGTAAAAAGASGSAFRRLLPWLIAGVVAAVIGFGLTRPRLERTPADAAPVAQMTPSAQAVASGPGLRETVYFDVGDAALHLDAQTTITATAERIKRDAVAISITGYTDATGDAAHNAELAKARAKVVRDALMAAGVSDVSIHLQPPANTTGTGSDVAARRVEIAQVQ